MAPDPHHREKIKVYLIVKITEMLTIQCVNANDARRRETIMKGNMNLLKKWAVVGTDFVITALNVPVVFRGLTLVATVATKHGYK